MYIHRNHEGLSPKNQPRKAGHQQVRFRDPPGKVGHFARSALRGFSDKRSGRKFTSRISSLQLWRVQRIHITQTQLPDNGSTFLPDFFFKWQFLVFVSGFLWVTFIFQMNFCRQIRPLSMAGCGNSKVVNSYVYDTNHGLQATWFSRLRVTLFGDFFPADQKKTAPTPMKW